MTLSLTRRAVLCGVSLAVALLLFRAPLASAIVTRGDDALRAGDTNGAIDYYERARHLDPTSVVALDRLAFHLALRRGRGDAERALTVIAHAPVERNAPLLADRAFAEMHLARLSEAEHDFTRAAALDHDARYAQFAARLAQRRGDPVHARAHLADALRYDPQFSPALALAKALR